MTAHGHTSSGRRRDPTRLALFFCLLGAGGLGAGGLSAQEPAPASPSPQALLAQLRASDVTLAAATAAATRLQEQSTALRLQASDLLRDAYLARLSRHQKALDRAQKAVEKVSGAVQRTQLGNRGEARAAELRSTSLGVSMRADLSKDRIQRELDPIVTELQSLLLPTRDQVLAAEPTLAEMTAALRSERGELAAWFALYVAMVDGFDLHPDAQKHLEKNLPPNPPPLPAHVDDEFIEWLLLGLPLSARDRRTVQENALLRARVDAEEFAGTQALNTLRYVLGLPLLRIDLKLGEAARDHSHDMVNLGFFDHSSPVAGKRTFADRASRFGASASSENIAAGHDSGPGAIRGWWYSPGHHRNMLGGHARTGLGRSGSTWTQLFGS